MLSEELSGLVKIGDELQKLSNMSSDLQSWLPSHWMFASYQRDITQILEEACIVLSILKGMPPTENDMQALRQAAHGHVPSWEILERMDKEYGGIPTGLHVYVRSVKTDMRIEASPEIKWTVWMHHRAGIPELASYMAQFFDDADRVSGMGMVGEFHSLVSADGGCITIFIK